MTLNRHSDLIHRTEYDQTEDLAFVVVDAVAIAAEASHAEIGPLNDVIDPEALCELFSPRPDGRDRLGGTISFRLDGYRVTVDATESEVRVYG